MLSGLKTWWSHGLVSQRYRSSSICVGCRIRLLLFKEDYYIRSVSGASGVCSGRPERYHRHSGGAGREGMGWKIFAAEMRKVVIFFGSSFEVCGQEVGVKGWHEIFLGGGGKGAATGGALLCVGEGSECSLALRSLKAQFQGLKPKPLS